MKNSIILLLILLLAGCRENQEPFSESLMLVIDKFVREHPEYNVIDIKAQKLEQCDFYTIAGSITYDSKLMDGYTFYKDKLVTYYQCDSLDRYPVVNMKRMKIYHEPIHGFLDFYLSPVGYYEPYMEFYVVDKHGVLRQANKMYSDKRRVTGHNVIRNKELNDTLNEVIGRSHDPLIELRFVKEGDKHYVIMRSMICYNNEKYDGYFYRNGHLVVLYDTNQTDILDNSWIKKSKNGIPNYKPRNIERYTWNCPFPLKYEILPDGHLKMLPYKKGFFK